LKGRLYRHSFLQIIPIINGFDEVELSAEEEACLEKDEPGHIRQLANR